MNVRLGSRGVVLGLMLSSLSACSTIKSWFPDKERDYQFTTEIPELIVPDDLKNKGLNAPLVRAQVPPVVEATPSAKEVEAPEASANDAPAKTQTTHQQPAAESAVASTGANRNQSYSSLQIDQPQVQAARLVGKALSRQKMEIVERNFDKGYFYVKYDPAALKASDDSIFDELNFLFGEDPSDEQEYRLSLREINPQLTEVTVEDSEGKSLANAAATSLLKLITEGINQDVGQDRSESAAPEKTPE